jgi:hypothetical protein
VHQLQLGGEGPAGLGAEAFQRADLLVAQEGSTSCTSKLRPAGILVMEKPQPSLAPAGTGAGEAAVVFLHHAAAVGAGVASVA